MKKVTERDHIKAHEKAFATALTKAALSIRQQAKLVGLDKIREPLAHQAALKATGYEVPCFSLPKSLLDPEPETQEMLDRTFAAAVDAASR